MRNFIQRGDMITVTAPAGGLASGQGVLVGNLFGVAAKAAGEDESVEIATVGVYELPKLASAVIAAGARVAWDDTAKQVVLPGTGMVPIGIATVAAGNGVASIRVRLDGVATQTA
jgi:predicted RecA/RadA family phage recombinase